MGPLSYLQQQVPLREASDVHAASIVSTHSRTHQTGFAAPGGRCRESKKQEILLNTDSNNSDGWNMYSVRLRDWELQLIHLSWQVCSDSADLFNDSDDLGFLYNSVFCKPSHVKCWASINHFCQWWTDYSAHTHCCRHAVLKKRCYWERPFLCTDSRSVRKRIGHQRAFIYHSQKKKLSVSQELKRNVIQISLDNITVAAVSSCV